MTAPLVGIGLRGPHIDALLARADGPPWVEVHSENWLAEAGPIAERLAAIGKRFDLSLHGVGLSLGSAAGIDAAHLRRLAALVGRCAPVLVSDHLCWSAANGRHSNDLLPLPYTPATARLLAERIDQVQQHLGRRFMVENVSSYCTFADSTMPEWAWVRDIVERADCGLLLDINNIHVNACNHGFAAEDYLAAMPWERVDEVHLAGYEIEDGVLIDTHGRPVQPPVWELLAQCGHQLRSGTRILIEWDAQLPSLDMLLSEAAKAAALLRQFASREDLTHVVA